MQSVSALKHDPPLRRACAFLAVLSTLLVFTWVTARIHFAFAGNWTAVFYTGTKWEPPPGLQAGTDRVKGTGYDGQFYRYLAHDPFLTKGYYRYVDLPRMRFRRLFVPLLAWLLALGRQDWIDGAFVAVEMFFLGLGVYWCARWLQRRGRSPLWGFLFVILPGTLASFDRMLVDGPLAALFAGFMLYCEERRWRRVWILALLAALTRETGLLLGAALVLDRLWRRDLRRAWLSASTAVPALLWYGYVALRVPPDRPVSILAVPGWGFLRRLLWLQPYPDPRLQLLLRVTDVLAVLGLAITIVIAARWLWESVPGPVTICAGSFALLALVLGAPDHMIDAFGFARPVSPLLLWVMLEAGSRKAWIALTPPLLVSLSVSLAFGRSLIAVVKGLSGL